jgi:hypothetical protein
MSDEDNAFNLYTNPYPTSNKPGQPRDWASKRQRWEQDAAQAATDAVYERMHIDGRMHTSLAALRRDTERWAATKQDVADAQALIERCAEVAVQMLEIGQFPERLMPRLVLAVRALLGDPQAQDALDRATMELATAKGKETQAHGTHGDNDGRGDSA